MGKFTGRAGASEPESSEMWKPGSSVCNVSCSQSPPARITPKMFGFRERLTAGTERETVYLFLR